MSEHKTSYTPESLDKAIGDIKELKNIIVRAQDFEGAALLRELERSLVLKKEVDKNRRI